MTTTPRPAEGGGTPRLYVVRHAVAEPKRSWVGPDTARPLTPLGWEQAWALVRQFAPWPVRRVVTSPASRCRQTVEPLAAARGLSVEESPALGVGGTPAALRALAARPGMRDAVWCTHGEVLDALLGWLASTTGGPGRRHAQKGSVSVLEDLAGAARLRRYLPPPRTVERDRA